MSAPRAGVKTELKAGKSAAPKIMGILNVTPDSFYPGSRCTEEEAVRLGFQLAEDGADALDVGGESTRPGSEPVSEEEELRRTLPVIERLARRLDISISIDTSKSEVARRALDSGAVILNDVTALRGDVKMPETALLFPHVILMHMRGKPKSMQENPQYADVVDEILAFFNERVMHFTQIGGDPSRLLLDPGLGFGKTLEHNLEILRRLEEFKTLGRRLVVGYSRKAFLGTLASETRAPLPVEDRLEGSLAAACHAALAGVDVIRVHDVRATRRVLKTFAALRAARGKEK